MSGLKPKEKPEKIFTKRAITQSAKYAQYRDILTALLDDDKFYSTADIEKTIDDFMKG